jgi:hypothetical protein
VVACWWGHNLDVAGGGGHLVENNVAADNALHGVLTVNLPGSYPMYPLTSATIRNNTLLRGGGNYANQRRGAIWVYADSSEARNVLFENNDILQPAFRAIHLTGDQTQQMTFRGNRIDGPGQDAVVIAGSARGSGRFENNTLTGLKSGYRAVVNGAGAAYTVTESGNSWNP